MKEQIDAVDEPPATQENFVGPPQQEVQPRLEKPVRAPLKGEAVTTIDLTSTSCRWPFGDPANPDFHYCGQPSHTGRVGNRFEDAERPSAAPANFLNDRPRAGARHRSAVERRADVVDDNCDTRLCNRQRVGATQATGSAGYDRNFRIETHQNRSKQHVEGAKLESAPLTFRAELPPVT